MSAAFRTDLLRQRPRRRPAARDSGRGDAADVFVGLPPAVAPQAAEQRGSIFASLVSGGARRRDDADPVPARVPPAAGNAPLSALGFGPNMLIRLRQLGVETTAALARADADMLRVGLGEISRLVDVEGWIQRARQAAGSLD